MENRTSFAAKTLRFLRLGKAVFSVPLISTATYMAFSLTPDDYYRPFCCGIP